MISTRDLSLLPDVDALRRTLKSMAMLDAVLCPNREFRYYSFNSAWTTRTQVGAMVNGSGDDLFAHFSRAGCWLKGFAHEFIMTPYRQSPKQVWPGVLDAVPEEFIACLREPALSVSDTTFCIWRRYSDRSWQVGPVEFPPGIPDPDGSEDLLENLDGRPESYQAWAEEYYERDVSLSAVEHVYSQRPLTPEVVAELNPAVLLKDLATDMKRIGYPEGTQQQ